MRYIGITCKIIIIILIVVFFLYWQNNDIVVSKYELSFENLPESFNEYRIVQISDLHNKLFGKSQEKLVSEVIELNPDIIVITGDLVDGRDYNEQVSLALINEIIKIAPVYYVTGNHEWRSGRFNSLEKKLINSGVNVLRNKKTFLSKVNDQIIVIGIDDPAFFSNVNNEYLYGFIETLNRLAKGKNDEDFIILLSHHPELFKIYKDAGIDLVFAGHAHGGQIRLPFIGGLVAPNQGLFPKYTEGIYKEGKSIMVVSRGLGNSIFPQRLFNRPEVVLVVLKKTKLW